MSSKHDARLMVHRRMRDLLNEYMQEPGEEPDPLLEDAASDLVEQLLEAISFEVLEPGLAKFEVT